MKMRTKKELFELNLPKWPQLIVTGESVTPEQALEVIRRTDSFFNDGYGGNNHEWNDKVIETTNYPKDSDFDFGAGSNFFDGFEFYVKAINEWKKNWQYVTTEYVHNSWISCAYIGGPNGWMHPDGVIGFSENIGKWPSIKEVYDDFCIIAHNFSFLNMEATLMSGEQCEYDIHPVVSFKIKDGKVRVIDPNYKDVHNEQYPKKYKNAIIKDKSIRWSSECAIPLETIQSWVENQKNVMGTETDG